MKSHGAIVKRCGCLDPATGRTLGKSCPRLPEPDHGSWYFHCSTRNLLGQAERVRRGGYASEAAARQARDELLILSREQQAGWSWTVTRWLRYWLSTRTRIRPTTRMHYTRDVERFLVPHVGHLILGDLTSRQLNAAFTQIAATRNRSGQPQTPCTLRHVHTTLRAALNAAIREGLIVDNPARRVELPAQERPLARLWTENRVAEWEATGERPSVAVWTPVQLAAFLDYVHDDNLFALWWLIALRGLRRGEAAGLRWTEIDLQTRQLSIVRQRTTAGYDVHDRRWSSGDYATGPHAAGPLAATAPAAPTRHRSVHAVATRQSIYRTDPRRSTRHALTKIAGNTVGETAPTLPVREACSPVPRVWMCGGSRVGGDGSCRRFRLPSLYGDGLVALGDRHLGWRWRASVGLRGGELRPRPPGGGSAEVIADEVVGGWVAVGAVD
ncbi:hypothetical protein ABGB16_29105 [Micromonospora sp. B11E3]|uniref:tyrosine-type recombinase/integrase n=1 Tax=Micromonospora sp. B11E3 TaxID=3153562 RepID=UPI00325CCC16